MAVFERYNSTASFQPKSIETLDFYMVAIERHEQIQLRLNERLQKYVQMTVNPFFVISDRNMFARDYSIIN